MFVFIPGSIPPVKFGPGGTDPAEISIPAVTYIYKCSWPVILDMVGYSVFHCKLSRDYYNVALDSVNMAIKDANLKNTYT